MYRTLKNSYPGIEKLSEFLCFIIKVVLDSSNDYSQHWNGKNKNEKDSDIF